MRMSKWNHQIGFEQTNRLCKYTIIILIFLVLISAPQRRSKREKVVIRLLRLMIGYVSVLGMLCQLVGRFRMESSTHHSEDKVWARIMINLFGKGSLWLSLLGNFSSSHLSKRAKELTKKERKSFHVFFLRKAKRFRPRSSFVMGEKRSDIHE